MIDDTQTTLLAFEVLASTVRDRMDDVTEEPTSDNEIHWLRVHVTLNFLVWLRNTYQYAIGHEHPYIAS